MTTPSSPRSAAIDSAVSRSPAPGHGTPRLDDPRFDPPAALRLPRGLDREPTPSEREIEDFVARTARPWLGSPVLLRVTVPGPAVRGHGLAALRPSGTAGTGDDPFFLWRPSNGDDASGGAARDVDAAGLGAAVTLRASGEHRFRTMRDLAERLTGRVVDRTWPGLAAPEARFYGGFAFREGSADEPMWGGRGDACFTLPRLLAVREPGSHASTLTLALDCRSLDRRGLDLRIAELRAALRRLDDSGPGDLARESSRVSDGLRAPSAPSGTADERAEFVAAVERILSDIHHGRFRKAVAARRHRAGVVCGVDGVGALLARLEALPHGTRFAFEAGGDPPWESLFVGNTPERLVTRRRARQGAVVLTEALAGSIDATLPDAEERLLASDKDLAEHALVVDHLLCHLRPVCSLVEWRHTPAVRRAQRLCHLHTPVTGRTEATRHVLELVERLHPTPAVAGAPTEEALRALSECEPFARGWYAAPVGWFSLSGDGDFRVALRSALISGRERSLAAHLWAGAGIVTDSEPEREAQETDLKLRPMLELLQLAADRPEDLRAS